MGGKEVLVTGSTHQQAQADRPLSVKICLCSLSPKENVFDLLTRL